MQSVHMYTLWRDNNNDTYDHCYLENNCTCVYWQTKYLYPFIIYVFTIYFIQVSHYSSQPF